MNARILIMLATLLAIPAFGQTVYKCPDASGAIKFQQMPCSPTGGGEQVTVNAQKPSGDGGLRPEERQALQSLSESNAAIAKARADAEEKAHEERKREEAMNIERSKAAAQWETARAIWATGGRP